MTDRFIMVPRKSGRGGAYMRVHVCRSRRCVRKVVRRMVDQRWPRHDIARRLRLPRLVVDRMSRRVMWHG
jgi:hypothetical protein